MVSFLTLWFCNISREFYNENEEKYKVSPKLILPELPCISCIKDTNLWHRAKVLKIVDEKSVQVLMYFKYILFNFNFMLT